MCASKSQNTVIRELQGANWDFVYFGHGLPLDPNQHNSSQPQKIRLQEYSKPIRLSHFLAINQSAMTPLIDFLEEVSSRPSGHPEGGAMHVDGAYSTFRKRNPNLITLVANPSFGFQRASPSNVAGYKWFDTLPVLMHLATAVRQAKNWYQRAF